MEKEDFGQVLKDLRIRRGKRLRELARELNTSSGYLSLVERGRRPALVDHLLQKARDFLEPSDEEWHKLIDAANESELGSRYRRKALEEKIRHRVELACIRFAEA